jgi:hypothetical protein
MCFNGFVFTLFLVVFSSVSSFSANASVAPSNAAEPFIVNYLSGYSTPVLLSDSSTVESEIEAFSKRYEIPLSNRDYFEMKKRLDLLKSNRLSSVFSAVLDGQSFCFISIKKESVGYIFGNKKVFLDDEFAMIHELEHCVEWSRKLRQVDAPIDIDEPEGTVYREMYADVAALFYLTLKNRGHITPDDVAFFRSLALRYNGDINHWTYLALKAAKRKIDSGTVTKENYRLEAMKIVGDVSKKYTQPLHQCISKSLKQKNPSRLRAGLVWCDADLGEQILGILDEIDEGNINSKKIAFYKEVK